MKYLRFITVTIFFSMVILKIYAQETLDSTGNDRINEYRIVYNLKRIDSLKNIDTKAALKIANEALQLSKEISSAELTADCYLSIGILYSNINYYSQSLFYLTHALDYYKIKQDEASRIKTLYQIGKVYRGSKEFEQAGKYFTEVLNYAEKHNDTLLIIKSLSEKGAILGNLNELDKSIEIFKHCINLSKRINNKVDEVKNRYYLADALMYSNKLEASINEFELLENNYEIQKILPRILPSFHASMSSAYLRYGDLGKALEFYNKSAVETQASQRLSQKVKHAYLSFKIDTALGNYKSAVDKLLLYSAIEDSFLNYKVKEQLNNFESIYNLDEKNKTIETLSSLNKVKEIQLKQNKRYMITLLIVFGLVLFVVHLILKSRKKLRNKNVELKKVLNELKATQQNLVQSEKMASLGTLIAGVAHEINNPLNFISGGVELMKVIQQDIEEKQYSHQETLVLMKEPLQIIEEGIDRSTSIVNSLSTFSYSADAKKVDYSVTEIIDSTLRYVKTKLTNIEIVKHYHFIDPFKIYPDKLHQVFLNLIDNAVFALNEQNVNPKIIQITTEKVFDEVIIKVANTGAPIPEEVKQKIFDPFYTTKGPGKGTGLGLSICYKLINEHGGNISVECIDGKVIFFVRLPYEV